MKFKVGDKVLDKKLNETGIVVSIRHTRVAPYHVKFGSVFRYKSARDMEALK